MAEYIYINDFQKRGTLGISRVVFTKIVESALKKVDGISMSNKVSKKNHSARLSSPIEVTIDKDIVHVSIHIDILKGKNIQDVTARIQNEINNAFMTSIEQIPFDVQVRVESII